MTEGQLRGLTCKECMHFAENHKEISDAIDANRRSGACMHLPPAALPLRRGTLLDPLYDIDHNYRVVRPRVFADYVAKIARQFYRHRNGLTCDRCKNGNHPNCTEAWKKRYHDELSQATRGGYAGKKGKNTDFVRDQGPR